MTAILNFEKQITMAVKLSKKEYTSISQVNKPVVCMSKDMSKVIAEYNSIKEAANTLGVDSGKIVKACNNVITSAHGYTWIFRHKVNDLEALKKYQDNPKPKHRIIRLSMPGVSSEVYNTLSDACKHVNACQQAVLKCCMGIISDVKGLKYKFGGDRSVEQCGIYSAHRKVDIYSDFGVYIKTVNSVEEAAKQCELSKSAVYMCCRGITKTAGRFIFKYKE